MIVFDLETQRLAAEVGGWANIESLGLAVAVTWDEENGYRVWWESQAADLLGVLRGASGVVGFNVTYFDYRVLALYGPVDLGPKTFDLAVKIQEQGHKKVGLSRLGLLNLGEGKLDLGEIDPVGLWRTGDLERLQVYCQRDVELTRRLYEHWQQVGILWVSEMAYAVWPGRNT